MATDPGKRLVLLRHAKSAWPDLPDHERPLASRGRRDAPAAGRWLLAANYVPDQVLCSTARRARETWQLAEAALVEAALVEAALVQAPPVVFEHGIYGASAAGLLDLIKRAPPAARTVVVVGHDPGVQDLALALTAADSDAHRSGPGAADRMRAKFPTAAIAVAEFSGRWSELGTRPARLAAFVTPREMPGGGRRRTDT